MWWKMGLIHFVGISSFKSNIWAQWVLNVHNIVLADKSSRLRNEMIESSWYYYGTTNSIAVILDQHT